MTFYEKLHKARTMGFFLLPNEKKVKRKILFPPDSRLAVYVEETPDGEIQTKTKITMIQAESLIEEAADFID